MLSDEIIEQVSLIRDALQRIRAGLAGMLTTLTAVGEAFDELLAMIEQDPPPPLELQVAVKETKPGTALLEWTTTLQPPTWRVGRNEQDTSGSGPWSTTLPGTARSQQFNLLKPGTAYTFTVSGQVGDSTVTRTATLTTSQPTTPPTGGTTAAERFGWGNPHPVSDEFDYTGQPDPTKWMLPGPDWEGHGGRGRRRPERTTVRDGMMVMTALANGDAAWVRQRMPTRYGRWEQRSRSRNTSTASSPYHVLSLIWPTREDWPRSGELDWLETENPDQTFFRAYLHYPHPPAPDGKVQQEIVTIQGVDQREWHNYGFEWTPNHIAGFIDGREVYRFSGGAGPAGRSAIQAMPEGALTMQIDHFGGTRECVYEIQWVKFYPLP